MSIFYTQICCLCVNSDGGMFPLTLVSNVIYWLVISYIHIYLTYVQRFRELLKEKKNNPNPLHGITFPFVNNNDSSMNGLLGAGGFGTTTISSDATTTDDDAKNRARKTLASRSGTDRSGRLVKSVRKSWRSPARRNKRKKNRST